MGTWKVVKPELLGIIGCIHILISQFSICVLAQEPPDGYYSATSVIERYHRSMDGLNETDRQFAAAALNGRPASDGFVASDRFPIRSHYPSEEFRERAGQILAIAEESWEIQVNEWGFFEPPPDCGYGGSDDLDIYIQSLPAGVGGYAAFACYIESTPWADAASFIAIADNLNEAFLRSAVTHEFNHVLQNAMDYWEHITFKENTATWAMEWMYGEDDQYFGYLRAYQKNPDWPHHKFSATTTYQYGGCMLLHFLSEYYAGGHPSIVVDIWRACMQNEYHNEPDFFEAIAEIVPIVSNGMDSLDDAMTEYAVWRTITAGRDDGVHFHDGGRWPSGAEIAFDTEISAADFPPAGLIITPNKSPFDYGFSFIRLNETAQAGSSLSIEFSGDPDVDWGVVLISPRDQFTHHVTRQLSLQNGWGIELVNKGFLDRADEVIIGIVNLSHDGFDPNDGTDGTRRYFSVKILPAVEDTSLCLWTNQPMTMPGMPYALNVDLDFHSPPGWVDFWLLLEWAGEFFPVFTDTAGHPGPITIHLNPGLSVSAPVLQFNMPELPLKMPVCWHGALVANTFFQDYATCRSNLFTDKWGRGE